MSLISPPALRAGDTVAIVSLSAGVSAAVPHRHDAGVRQLERTFDVLVVDAPNARRDDAFLRANPRARADDLHWALTEDAVAGILTSIGGDDSIRMIPYLDFDMIHDHPKVFMGFSDSTVQHLANRVAGVVSFYGPSLLTAFAENGGIHPYVEECVRDALFRSEPLQLRAAPEWTDERLDWANPVLAGRRRRWWPNPGWAWLQGTEPVEGELIGGCADTLETVKGTPIWPPPSTWDGAVLLLGAFRGSTSAVHGRTMAAELRRHRHPRPHRRAAAVPARDVHAATDVRAVGSGPAGAGRVGSS